MVRKVIPESVRHEAIDLVVVNGYSIATVCQMVGIGQTALRRWVQEWREAQAAVPQDGQRLSADQRRIKELERQVATLQEEREVLKKSVAFFVKDSDRSWK
jgi:transposase